MADNIFKNIPKNLPEELFETLVKNDHLHIERIVSYGQSTPDKQWYDQERNEWVLLLKGAAKIKFEKGEIINLQPGDYLNIAAHKKHRVEWTQENTQTIWLAIHY
ncbi:MAG: cupin [Gammaproteobacteria bacterium]|nr:cupin [Gammaproteobacteria bacterium]MCW9055637.1 cupin [Gammaproteobacteria bacterium]